MKQSSPEVCDFKVVLITLNRIFLARNTAIIEWAIVDNV